MFGWNGSVRMEQKTSSFYKQKYDPLPEIIETRLAQSSARNSPGICLLITSQSPNFITIVNFTQQKFRRKESQKRIEFPIKVKQSTAM